MDADIWIDPREEALRGRQWLSNKRSVQLPEVVHTTTELLFLGAVEIDLGIPWLVATVIDFCVTLPDLRQRAAEVVVKRPLYTGRRRAAGKPNLVKRDAKTGTSGG